LGFENLPRTPLLLERDEPLALMQGPLREAGEGNGHTFLIGGEAGIGKNALLESFTHANKGSARVLWGACESLATARPLGPLNDIAGELGRRAARRVSCEPAAL